MEQDVVDEYSKDFRHDISTSSARKHIDKSGGEIPLENVDVLIPPDSVRQSVGVSVLAIDRLKSFIQREDNIKNGCLNKVLQPGTRLRLLPYGKKFTRKVTLKLKNLERTGRAKVMILGKDVEPDKETLWTDITEACDLEDKGDEVILKIDKFSIIQVFFFTKMSFPIAAKFACGILNKEAACCTFNAYYKPEENGVTMQIIVILEDSEVQDCKPGYVEYGSAVSNIELFDGERLRFYYDACNKIDRFAHMGREAAVELQLKLSECRDGGQCMTWPVDKQPPSRFCIHRSEPEDRLCTISRESMQETADDMDRPETTSKSDSMVCTNTRKRKGDGDASHGLSKRQRNETLLEKISELTTAKDPNKEGRDILDILDMLGEGVLEQCTEAFMEMIRKVFKLIGWSYYIEIIKKMADIYKNVEEKPQVGPMECLSQQVESEKAPGILSKHGERLFSLIQMIRDIDTSPQSRERCLRILIKNTDFASWREKIAWRIKAIEMLGLLLEEGANPTWVPKDACGGSVLFQLLQMIPLILDYNNQFYDDLRKILRNYLTEECLNPKETEETALHALVGYKWSNLSENLPEDFLKQYKEIIDMVVAANPALLDKIDSHRRTPLQCFIQGIIENECKHLLRIVLDISPALKSETNLNAKDKDGQTVLHMLAGKYKQIGHESFPKLARCLGSSANVDAQDVDGRTVFHILAETLFEHPELGLGSEILKIFDLLQTKENVNLPDKDSTTPFSWILVAKARWENNEKKVFTKIEDNFLSNGADADRAEGPAKMKPIYRWIGQEFSDRGCTLDRLKKLHKEVVHIGEAFPNMKKFEWLEPEVWIHLNRIGNAKWIPIVKDILKFLVADESVAAQAMTSIIKYARKNSAKGVKDITLGVMEMLCLCAERGAQPSVEDLQTILEMANARKWDEEFTLYYITANEELTLALLKTLVTLSRSENFVETLDELDKTKPISCHLQFLGDFYIISPQMLELGRPLVHKVYRTMHACLDSKNLIDILLYISNEAEKTEIQIEDLSCKNWLKRSLLHLAAIILNSKKAWKCVPENIVTKYLNAQDLHGCTPLHLAYLHDNKEAVQFLKDHKAQEDVKDKFGTSPKSLGRTTDNPDDEYRKLSRSVLEVERGVVEELKPMLVHSEDAANSLSNEVRSLLVRLIKGTQFANADVVMCGSMREKLKAGRFDEADIQLRFKGEGVGHEFSIAGHKHKWIAYSFLDQMFSCLRKRLTEITWGIDHTDSEERIDLRPISIHGPWKFLRKGVTVSLDVVALIVYETGIKGYRCHQYTSQEEALRLQGELFEKNHTSYATMQYCTLKTWSCNDTNAFKETLCVYEWDMIDRLPASCRLAIVIAKALVQAYDWCRDDRLRVEMPVTSYTIKTALFYILSYNSGQFQFGVSIHKCLMLNALGNVEGNKSEVQTGASKLEYNSHAQPRWLTDDDVSEHGEEARGLARKIFSLIIFLAQERDCDSPQGWKLNSYWNRKEPVVKIEGYGEAEYICDVCKCALERLNQNTFFKDNA